MMEFTLGLFAGLLLWPWWALSLFVVLCLIDAALVENESATFGTFLMIVGTGALVWVAGDMNPFVALWHNLGAIILFFFAYFLVGGVWSIFKWYFYLKGVKQEMDRNDSKERPYRSYAANNKAKIMAWIGHWPFSIVGTVIGDFVFEIGRKIFDYLGGTYERIENHVFGNMK